MTIPAWHVATWKPVVASMHHFDRTIGKLRHLGTSLQTSDGESGLRCGQVIWGTDDGSGRIGLAWDWAEVRAEVVALVDPMNVVSNLALVDDDGRPLSEQQRILHLNCLIHELDWQPHVCTSPARASELQMAA